MDILTSPIKVNQLLFKNRLVMSALTRCRADPLTYNPTPQMEQYYAQRSTQASLIFTEGLPISRRGNPYFGSAGLFNNQHALLWKNINQLVHENNCYIFAQIYHGGRLVPSFISGQQPLIPFIQSFNKILQEQDKESQDFETPKQMTKADINEVIQEFRESIRLAKKADFDGIQIHAAYGNLISQFFDSSLNKRKDNYGGSLEKRTRFLFDVFDIAKEFYSVEKIAFKFSFFNFEAGYGDQDPYSTMAFVLKELNGKGTQLVELVDPQETKYQYDKKQFRNICDLAKTFYQGKIIINHVKSLNEGLNYLKNKKADFVSFGTLFISNPDLFERIVNEWPLAQIKDEKSMIQNTGYGYVDYPCYKN